jgi:hypothetical protein
MSIPNHIDVVRRLATEHPSEWSAAHRGGAGTELFIRRLAATLHAMDPRFGLNGKRGNPNDISDDAINFDGESLLGDVDPTRGNAPVTVLDVIGSAPSGPTGPDGTPAWQPVTDPRVRPTLAAWVRPAAVSGGGTGGGGGGIEPPPPPTSQGLTRAQVQSMIDAAIAPLPKYGDRIALRAHAGKVLCAEGGGPTEDGEAFVLTSRSGVGPWEQWTILKP